MVQTALPPAVSGDLELVLAEGVRTVFQPIIDLTTSRTIGFEALSRGPATSSLENPERMFAAARNTSRLAELDWTCRCAAFRAAFESGLRAPYKLFVNAEPQVIGSACPQHLIPDWLLAHRELDVVIEVTERYLLDAPAELLRVRGTLEELGWEVALDDVGANDAGVALLPVLRPGVVKLDRPLLAAHLSRSQRAVLSAVLAYVERSGAALIAEGIETEAECERAKAFGAHWGQGWLFGRPAPLALPPRPREATGVVRRPPGRRQEPRARVDPFGQLEGRVPAETVGLEAVRRGIDAVCRTAGDAAAGSLLIVQLGSAEVEPPGLYRMLDELHDVCALVVVLAGKGLTHRSAVVRTTVLDPGDESATDGAAVLLGPDRAHAFLARPGAAGWERRELRDRDLVAETAQALLARAAPLRRGGRRPEVELVTKN